jgi:hypothetical protein
MGSRLAANASAAARADGASANSSGAGSGLVVELSEPQVLDTLLLVSRTNDDIWQWDPKTWVVYGSNESPDPGAAVWTRLGGGDAGLGNERGAVSTLGFNNVQAFRYYSVQFPTTKGSYQGKSYLHVAEAQLLRSAPIAAGSFGQDPVLGSPGSSPQTESVDMALDGRTSTKYLNFAGPGSGLTVSLAQPQALDTLLLVSRTNDDLWQWDPQPTERQRLPDGQPMLSAAALEAQWSYSLGSTIGSAHG